MSQIYHPGDRPSTTSADTTAVTGPVRSAASIFAILAAIVSFYFSSHGREILGLLCALFAIGGGLLGGLRALSPRVTGGVLSIIAVLLGAIAILVALVALIV